MNATFAIHLAELAIVVYVVFQFALIYARSTATTRWARTIEAGKGSATILWARFVIAVAAGVDGLSYLASVLGAPGVAEKLPSILKPEYVALLTVGIAVVAELARRRTLNKPGKPDDQ